MPRSKVTSDLACTVMKVCELMRPTLLSAEANTRPSATVKNRYPSWNDTEFGCGRVPRPLYASGAPVKTMPGLPAPPDRVVAAERDGLVADRLQDGDDARGIRCADPGGREDGVCIDERDQAGRDRGHRGARPDRIGDLDREGRVLRIGEGERDGVVDDERGAPDRRGGAPTPRSNSDRLVSGSGDRSDQPSVGANRGNDREQGGRIADVALLRQRDDRSHRGGREIGRCQRGIRVDQRDQAGGDGRRGFRRSQRVGHGDRETGAGRVVDGERNLIARDEHRAADRRSSRGVRQCRGVEDVGPVVDIHRDHIRRRADLIMGDRDLLGARQRAEQACRARDVDRIGVRPHLVAEVVDDQTAAIDRGLGGLRKEREAGLPAPDLWGGARR